MRAAAGKDVQEVFREVYERQKWGKSDDGFFSGPGSLDMHSQPYIVYVNRFMQQRGITNIVDLGCGDFRVGRQLVLGNRHYTGVDVVSELIRRNQERFGQANIQFQMLNIIEDELPDGELCLIRQVLQHLSNEAILKILGKLKKYRYVLITDDQLRKPNGINVDIPNFGGTRINFGSNLLLEEPPFNAEVKTVLEVPLANRNDRFLRTVLIAN